MKIIVLLACILATVLALEFHKNIKLKVSETIPECASSVGATEEDVAEIKAHRIPTTKSGKCLSSCLQKKFGIQGANGLPSANGVLQALEPLEAEDDELYTKMIDAALTCGPAVRSLKLEDHCDIAVETIRCFITEAKALGVEDPYIAKK